MGSRGSIGRLERSALFEGGAGKGTISLRGTTAQMSDVPECGAVTFDERR
jgi:hypothetical protein